MPQPSGLPSDEWMDARVEAFVDDALPPLEHARFESLLRISPHWREQVDRARAIRGVLRTQTSPSVPDDLTSSILRRASNPRSCCQKES